MANWDMQPDRFDWEAFFGAQRAFAEKDWVNFKILRDRYVASVPDQTREIWKLCRKTMPRFHMGRAEFLPIRKTAEAVSEYIGRYLEGGMQIRIHEWKGCRRVERDRRTAKLWNKHHREFAWVSPGASIWRQRLGEFAAAVDSKQVCVLDGKPGPKFDQIGSMGTDFGTALVFSPDSQHLGYAAKSGNKWCMVVDGVPGPEFDDVDGNRQPWRRANVLPGVPFRPA